MKRENLRGLVTFVLACIAASFVFVGCDMVTTRGAFTKGMSLFLWDTVTRRELFLEKAVSTTAPDGKTQLIIAPSGKLRWYNLQSGKVLVQTNLATEQYRRADVRWLSNQRVEIIAHIRHPLLLQQMTIVLNRDGGNNQETSLYRLIENRRR